MHSATTIHIFSKIPYFKFEHTIFRINPGKGFVKLIQYEQTKDTKSC